MASLLSYTLEGNGRPLVFLHGFCETKEIWKHFKGSFLASNQVICLDLPCHGESEGLGELTSVEAMAEAVNKTLQHLKIAKPVIIGHSLGGYVALAYAEAFPENLSGLCLFHSSAYADAPEKKENRNKTIDYVLKHGVDNFCNPFVPGLFFHKRRQLLKDQIEFALDIAKKMQVEDIVDVTRAMRDRKERIDVLESIKVPVAFIIGKEDSAVTLDKSIAQCYLPQVSQCLFLAETGHMGMFERERECVSFLEGFANAI